MSLLSMHWCSARESAPSSTPAPVCLLSCLHLVISVYVMPCKQVTQGSVSLGIYKTAGPASVAIGTASSGPGSTGPAGQSAGMGACMGSEHTGPALLASATISVLSCIGRGPGTAGSTGISGSWLGSGGRLPLGTVQINGRPFL